MPSPPLPRAQALSFLVSLTLLPGCGDGGAGPEPASSVSLSVAAGPDVGDGGEDWILTDGAHELGLRGVGLVVREVALTGGAVEEALETGPFLLDVPVDRRVRSWVAGAVRSGRYDRLRLALHTPDSADPDDRAFLADYPSLDGVALRIEGVWDGVPFLTELGLEDVRELLLEPPLEVRGRTVNVTLGLDVASWFRDVDGRLVDPSLALPGSTEAAALEARIRTSLSAYEDPDADGVAGGG